ncbi:MAG: sporulation integral membrane protein YtvI [Clostridia bacterium]|nr:sporulation integral membrane protein YtvI [Clostridia bacterium]
MVENSKRRKHIVLSRIAVFVGTLLVLFLVCKFALFFMPFLIAGIIAVLIEPIIKFCMNKLKMSRRMSSGIVVFLTVVLLIGVCAWGVSELVSELLNMTSNIGPAFSQVSATIIEWTSKISTEYSEIPQQVISTIQNSLVDFVGKLGNYIGGLATKAFNMVLSVPAMLINITITILALVFFTKDRIYVIDLLEHHLPKQWIKKTSTVAKDLGSTLGGYIKVYAKILFVTFLELFIAFSVIYKLVGFNIPYPFVTAFLIALLDILPVLGVGTALNPWAIYLLATGQYGFAVTVFLTYIAIFIIRQFIEQKFVSKQFGVHPIITLMAMYAGFKFMGFLGMLVGPIVLMVLRGIFAKQLDRGLFKDLFDEN